MKLFSIFRFALVVGALLQGGAIFSYVEEKFEFPFTVKNKKTLRNFILLKLPADVNNVSIEYRKIGRPLLILDYIAEDQAALDNLKRQVNVSYVDEDNQTIVQYMNPSHFGSYDCISDEHGLFKRGACLRNGKLILPPDIEATIYQNKVLIYTRADLAEIKKRQFPHLVKDDPATAKVKKQSTEAKLKELNSMLKKGLITKEEYEQKKKALLDGM